MKREIDFQRSKLLKKSLHFFDISNENFKFNGIQKANSIIQIFGTGDMQKEL